MAYPTTKAELRKATDDLITRLAGGREPDYDLTKGSTNQQLAAIVSGLVDALPDPPKGK